MTNEHWTGSHCGQCGSREFYVPGYLTTRSDGSKCFTVAREIEHKDDCPTLTFPEYGDWIDGVRAGVEAQGYSLEDAPSDYEAFHAAMYPVENVVTDTIGRIVALSEAGLL